MSEQNVAVSTGELGSGSEDFFSENRGFIYSLVALGALIVIAVGIYNFTSGKTTKKNAQAIYSYESNSLKSFSEGKTKVAELVAGFTELHAKIGKDASLSYSVISTIDLLMAKKKWGEALTVAKLGRDVNSDTFYQYFLGLREAVLFENSGELDQAITVLSTLSNSSIDILRNKVYLDLGRLYFQKGNMAKSKSSFEYVINKGEDGKIKNLAKRLLSKIK